jgi:hypothetical protein
VIRHLLWRTKEYFPSIGLWTLFLAIRAKSPTPELQEIDIPEKTSIGNNTQVFPTAGVFLHQNDLIGRQVLDLIQYPLPERIEPF